MTIGWWRGLRERVLGVAPEARAQRRFERARARLAAQAWPPGALEQLRALTAHGGRALLVGGTVRDALLGRPGDAVLDVATDLVPEQVMDRMPHVEPVGLRHGTVLIVGEPMIECTTFRREGDYGDARRPDQVTFTGDPIEDLARRDLTINALAFDPATGELLDPFGGLADLESGTLRAVGDPEQRFREDALRPLRVARLAATLEMAPEPATRQALGRVLDRARMIAWERVGQELRRLMEARRPSIGLELLREAGLLELWTPEIAAGYGVLQNRFHAYDVYEHSLHTVDAAPAHKPRVRWAALLHDVGKPSTREIRDGDATFYGHAEVSAQMADALLARLRFPDEERLAIVHLVREHMFEYRPEWSDAAVRRWVRRIGEDAIADLFDLRLADAQGSGKAHGFPAGLAGFGERIESVLAESRALHVRDLAIDGHDVMRVLGIPPGPEVGKVLDGILDRVLEDPALNRREILIAELERRAAS